MEQIVDWNGDAWIPMIQIPRKCKRCAVCGGWIFRRKYMWRALGSGGHQKKAHPTCIRQVGEVRR